MKLCRSILAFCCDMNSSSRRFRKRWRREYEQVIASALRRCATLSKQSRCIVTRQHPVPLRLKSKGAYPHFSERDIILTV